MIIVEIPVTSGTPDYSAGGGIAFYANTYPLPNGNLVGQYHGAESLPTYTGAYPPARTAYRTALKPGEVMRLLGPAPFAAINAAAYPTDGTPVDPQALFFLESAKYPYSDDGLLLVDRAPVTDAMAYFVSVGYITPGDAARVIAGQPYEVPL